MCLDGPAATYGFQQVATLSDGSLRSGRHWWQLCGARNAEADARAIVLTLFAYEHLVDPMQKCSLPKSATAAAHGGAETTGFH